jgi:hypothetical protein
MNIYNRKGAIKIARELMLKYVNEQYEEGNPLFRDFVPVDIKYDFIMDTMIYSGYSPHFKQIPEHEVPPEYEIRVTDGIKVEYVSK